eukprot:scaffold3051_cov236-Pinguiococcus_pyrenoidosus.AAC.7
MLANLRRWKVPRRLQSPAAAGSAGAPQQRASEAPGDSAKLLAMEGEKLQAALRGSATAAEVFKAMKAHRKPLLEDVDSVCVALHRLGRLPLGPHGDERERERLEVAMEGLGRLLESPRMLPRCDQRALANVMWAYATKGVHVDSLFDKVVQRLGDKQQVSLLSHQGAANVLWAYAVLGIGDGQSSLMRQLGDVPQALISMGCLNWFRSSSDIFRGKRSPARRRRTSPRGSGPWPKSWSQAARGRRRASPCPSQSIDQTLERSGSKSHRILERSALLLIPLIAGKWPSRYVRSLVRALRLQQLLDRLLQADVLSEAAPKAIADALWAVATLETAKGGTSSRPRFEGPEDWVIQVRRWGSFSHSAQYDPCRLR